MKGISVLDQFEIIHDPDNEEETKVPVMPILVVLNSGIFCPAYMVQKKHIDGSGCSSYALPIHESMREYTGGEYIDISIEYDIDELILDLCQYSRHIFSNKFYATLLNLSSHSWGVI